MKVEYTDISGGKKVLGEGESIEQLKSKVRDHYDGEELIIWHSGVYGKAYSNMSPQTKSCFFSLEDGTFYSIK